MPGPPTPVLNRPLVYLEIRDGESTRAYNSPFSHGALTLTIEGERQIDTELGALIVLIRKDVQQVVSLRLPVAEGGAQSASDMVTINNQASRLCIYLPGKPQAILVQFEEKRDFNVAVCLLQKAGFRVSDTIPISLLTDQSIPDITSNYGPLLSSTAAHSLLPSNTLRKPETQLDPSFTAMFNAPYQPSSISGFPNSRTLHTQRHVSVPAHPYSAANGIVSTPPAAVHLNPYNMFLGGGDTYPHMPRISSPLRNSVVPSTPSAQSFRQGIESHSFPNSLSPGSWSSPNTLMHSEFRPGSLTQSQVNNSSSQRSIPSLRREATEELIQDRSSQDESQEYRNLMPQPRKLPFESRKKDNKASGKFGPQDTTPVEAGKGPRTRKIGAPAGSSGRITGDRRKAQTTIGSRKRAKGENRQSILQGVVIEEPDVLSDADQRQSDDATISIPEVKRSKRNPKRNAYKDIQCQTEIPSGPNVLEGSLETANLDRQSPGHDISPLLVVTDPDALKALHEATVTLFEEYETELASCKDHTRHAELYLERIWEKRRDFWLKRLQDSKDVQCYCQADEILSPLDTAV
ncbi:uncharacterized protein FIESC28_03168 [Fusarium coffeatum]|uniref:Uncharacterized protein n=1 Tax=Fusarium coffeatum TaxID=231269 RepID=A0A366S5Z5_9HYPO|nr:uncharacterized protein FIESC28_03168 [Fusarium coffeatum]RBR24055.1 hypothetical protein FIESC28_03168 [Fusarium coffeatum]